MTSKSATEAHDPRDPPTEPQADVSRNTPLNAPGIDPKGNAERVQDLRTSEGVSAFYRRTLGPLIAMLRRHLGEGPPDPEDIAQQAYRKLLERPSLDDISNVDAFLWRTARNLVFNERRSRAIRSRYDYEVEQLFFPIEGADLGPERVVRAREQLALVRETLLAMPERRRRIFLLYRIDGLSAAAAGRELGISETAARKHIARAMAELDERLSENGD